MQLHIENHLPDRRMLWSDPGGVYFAHGMTLHQATHPGAVPLFNVTLGTSLEQILARFRPLRHLLRIGIHHCLPLADGGILVILRKRVLRLNANRKATLVMRFQRGNKPASKGVCIIPSGEVFIGEYAQNLKRLLPVVLYRSTDHGRTFRPILEFDPGDVRHIHFVQWDRFAQCLWMGTGDTDSESRLYRSMDNGDHWELIGGGSQLWRAVGIAPRPEAIYWGTDAGYDAGGHPNYIVRLHRKTSALDKLRQLQGPCHGNATLDGDILLISTGVEGGQNEKDGHTHLWASRDGKDWKELASFRKDLWPRILQFGVIRFPSSNTPLSNVVFTGFGLVGAGEKTFVGHLT